MSSPSQTGRGFTLMEVMIAMAVTALIGGLTTAAFHTGFKAKELVETEADHYRMIRTALSRMAREIGAAYVSDAYDSKRYRDANDRPTNFIGQKERLLFTSFAHQRLYTDAKESDQMVVEYWVQSSKEKGVRNRDDLYRRENPVLEERMDRGGSEEVLFEGAKKIEFSYWDAEKKEWTDEWDTRKVDRKTLLPTRVKITLTAADENGKEVPYSTQVRVVLNTELSRY